MLAFWEAMAAATSNTDRAAADRRLLAPARRACGLAINDAEETLDRIMLEPRVPLSGGTRWEEALTFVTYLRRMTRTVTTLAVVGDCEPATSVRAARVAGRLERLGKSLHAALDTHLVTPGDAENEADVKDGASTAVSAEGFAEQQLRRMERQAGVLERTAELLAHQ
jgi:hypothetical protein